MLVYYQPSFRQGYFKIAIDVFDFQNEDEIRNSQFGPYSNCSTNGYGTVKAWWYEEPKPKDDNEDDNNNNQNNTPPVKNDTTDKNETEPYTPPVIDKKPDIKFTISSPPIIMAEDEGISTSVIAIIVIILLVAVIGLGALYYKYKVATKRD